MSTKVLVVEDEPAFIEALEVGLNAEGFDVVVASSGSVAIDVFKKEKPDVVLLDVMLPEISGLDVCRTLKEISDTPIIMVSAKTSEVDMVVGLEVGADDYVGKPYRIRELVARIRAVKRRGATSTQTEPVTEIASDGITIDLDKHVVTVDGVEVAMPLREFALLAILMRNPGRVVTRDLIFDEIWGMDYVGESKTLDVHIKRLRSKVEPDPSKPTRIKTVRGLGYKFIPADVH